jgi:long-subunit acyl-CoA synthetase (AMP-forming)
MMKFVGGSTKFSELCKVFKILLILSHGQAQVERGFSVNKNLLVENQHTTSLTAQRIIHDHMVYHELESSNLTVTAKLSNHVKQARSRYFNEQKERSMQKVTSDRDVRMKQINEDIDDANRNITQLQETINSFQTSTDEYAFEAEEKSSVAEIKSLISKSNALKCAATEKQSLLDSLSKKIRLLIEKKDEL